MLVIINWELMEFRGSSEFEKMEQSIDTLDELTSKRDPKNTMFRNETFVARISISWVVLINEEEEMTACVALVNPNGLEMAPENKCGWDP